MKKQMMLATLAMATLWTACSNENEESVGQPMKVRFCVTNNNLTTRATTTTSGNTYTTAFDNGDAIIIYSNGLKTDMAGVTGTISSGGNVTLGSGDYYYKDQTTSVTFNAYHPTTAEYSEGTVSFTVATDQSTNFDANEFMVATATGKGSDLSPVALSFKHQLALVVLNLENLSEATEVTMNGVLPKVTYTFGGSLTTDESASRIDIKMCKQGGTQTYWAMVPAQTFAKDVQLFTITAGSTTYSYKVSVEGGLSTIANNVHQITLKKRLDAPELSASISNWNVATAWDPGEVEEVVPEPVVLINNETFDNVTIPSATSNTNISAGNWGYVFGIANSTTANGTVEIATEESPSNKALHIKLTTYSSWYNSTAYCAISGATRSKYRLTFKAMATGDSPSLLIFINGTKGTGENNALMQIISGNNTYSQITRTIKATWDTYTVDFDFAYKTDKGSTSSSTAFTETTDDNLNIIYLGFVPNGTSQTSKDFYIDDVTLTEVVE